MKDKKVQNILAYTDFTEVGEKTIQWAVFLAKKFQRNLQIVHVINENTYNYFNKNEAHFEVKETLEEYCKTIKEDHNVDCEYFVDEGCTCTIINSLAERVDAFLIIIGTHGKSDPQFLSGQSAVKIIRKSRIPYFVVQKKSPIPDDTKNIAMSLNSLKEMKEKTGWVTYFAKNIKTWIDIIYYEIDDSRLVSNISFCKKFFEKYELVYKKHILPKSRTSINKASLKIAFEENSLCLAIITTKEENLIHKIFGFPETKIISNSIGIPVLCVNPKKDLYVPCL
ncbi:MAG TPA: universal stress protein [Bacteroidales bacterium]|nr:universal stress protein [Bacteroidales bacterium]